MEDKLRKGRFKISNAGIVLRNGNALVAGDGKFVEVYDFNQNRFRTASGHLSASWINATVTALIDNRALIAGGYNQNMEATSRTWLYSTSKAICN